MHLCSGPTGKSCWMLQPLPSVKTLCGDGFFTAIWVMILLLTAGWYLVYAETLPSACRTATLRSCGPMDLKRVPLPKTSSRRSSTTIWEQARCLCTALFRPDSWSGPIRSSTRASGMPSRKSPLKSVGTWAIYGTRGANEFRLTPDGTAQNKG